jgi:hypothetical protein
MPTNKPYKQTRNSRYLLVSEVVENEQEEERGIFRSRQLRNIVDFCRSLLHGLAITTASS